MYETLVSRQDVGRSGILDRRTFLFLLDESIIYLSVTSSRIVQHVSRIIQYV
jgi:hypothetical protein